MERKLGEFEASMIMLRLREREEKKTRVVDLYSDRNAIETCVVFDNVCM